MSKMSPKIKVMWTAILAAGLKSLTGIRGWAIKTIVNYGGQYLYNLLDNWIKHLERTEKQNEAKKIYDKVQADPNSTPEERAKQYEDYINS